MRRLPVSFPSLDSRFGFVGGVGLIEQLPATTNAGRRYPSVDFAGSFCTRYGQSDPFRFATASRLAICVCGTVSCPPYLPPYLPLGTSMNIHDRKLRNTGCEICDTLGHEVPILAVISPYAGENSVVGQPHRSCRNADRRTQSSPGRRFERYTWCRCRDHGLPLGCSASVLGPLSGRFRTWRVRLRWFSAFPETPPVLDSEASQDRPHLRLTGSTLRTRF
jgi:hypothetical protein